MSLLPDIERILGENSFNRLGTIENKFAVSVKVFKPVNNVYSNVYGRDSGEESQHPSETIQAVVIGDDFFPADPRSGGGFKEGWLFTTSNVVNVGDRVEIERADCRHRRYEVLSMQSLGSSRSVFKKFRLSALGD